MTLKATPNKMRKLEARLARIDARAPGATQKHDTTQTPDATRTYVERPLVSGMLVETGTGGDRDHSGEWPQDYA